jgi:predicted enzyme related to lactoylglutathione lyase
MSGTIVHLEIPADNTDASLDFWGGMFGWQFQAFPGGAGEYHMTRLAETQGAAITNMEPGKKGMRPYFGVDDIDSGVDRVRELGGQADEKMPVPAMGWFATCRDPQGNEFGLWQNDESAPGM